MRVPRIYVDSALRTGSSIQLPLRQSNYLCKALRMEAGRELWLFNGQGGAYKSQIELPNPKKAQISVGEFDEENRQSTLNIELGIAVSKGDRFDFVVQKATELGVTSIRPLLTERIDVRLNAERSKKKLEHWQSISISACEQSGRNMLPVVDAPLTLEAWCSDLNQECRIIMDPYSNISLGDLASGQTKQQKVAVLIGPEGGFSETEVKLARNNGFTGITLGPRILRTETAPLVIISLLQSLWGDI